MPSSLDYNRIAAVAYSVRRFPDFIPKVGTISTLSTTLSFLQRATRIRIIAFCHIPLERQKPNSVRAQFAEIGSRKMLR